MIDIEPKLLSDRELQALTEIATSAITGLAADGVLQLRAHIAALERVLPLLPLVDVIERLETQAPSDAWDVTLSMDCDAYFAASEVDRWEGSATGKWLKGKRLGGLGYDTLPQAIAALLQAIESEAKANG